MARIDEYKDLLAKAGDADTAPEALSAILKMVEEDTTAIDTLTAAKTENEAKIKELQDTNIRLFLAQVKPEDKNEEEEERTISFEDFSKQL